MGSVAEAAPARATRDYNQLSSRTRQQAGMGRVKVLGGEGGSLPLASHGPRLASTEAGLTESSTLSPRSTPYLFCRGCNLRCAVLGSSSQTFLLRAPGVLGESSF